ncbi:hypothetical protein B4U80_11766, partial [Leptotrombidium deliense]
MQLGENLEKYFFDKLRLCNLYDDNMNELNKINVIMRGLTPSLVERVYLMEQKTTEELLRNLRLINEGVTFANSREDWNQSAKLQIAAIASNENEGNRRFENGNNYQQRNFGRESRRDFHERSRNQFNSNQFRGSYRGRGIIRNNQSYRISKASSIFGKHVVGSCEGRSVDFQNPRSFHSLIHVKVLINKHLVDCVVDTGSAISLINSSVVPRIGVRVEHCNGPVVTFANSQTDQLRMGINSEVVFRDNLVNQTFYVSDNLPFDAILGIDWCLNSNCVISCDASNCNVTPSGKTVNCSSVIEQHCLDFTVNSDIVLPSRTALWIPLQTNTKITGSLLLQPLSDNHSKFSIPYAVCSVIDGITGLYAMNTSPFEVTIDAGTKVAMCNLRDNASVSAINLEEKNDVQFDVNPDIPTVEKGRIHKLLKKYAQLFKPK